MASPFFTDAEERDLAPRGEPMPDGTTIRIFGAGNTGRDFLERLRRAGGTVAGFIDNNPALAGADIDGIPVGAPGDAALADPDSPVVAAAADFLNILAQCRDLGFANAMTMGDFIRRRGCAAELAAIAANPDAAAALDIWGDEESRRIYRALVRYRVTFDPADLPPAAPNQYFAAAAVRPRDLRAFVDCGAFIGDTLRSFRKACGGDFDHYYAVEASPENFARLAREAEGDPRIRLFNLAAGDHAGRMGYLAREASYARLSEHGTVTVDMDRLDNILADEPVTMLKMDVEGAEPEALEGALGIIREQRPALAVCTYHQAEHLWSLPLRIAGLNLGYRLKLLHHGDGYHGETVCYAIPEDTA